MSLVRRPATPSLGWPAGATSSGSVASPSASAPLAMESLRWLSVTGITAIGCLLVLAVAAPATATRMAVPLAVVGALLGVPHGAVDHLVPWWWGPSEAGRREIEHRRKTLLLAGFVSVYVMIAGLALAALLLAPTPTLLVFFVLSAVHFGRGEVLTSAERSGRPAPTATADLLVSTAFGCTVVGLLLWARPAETNPYLGPLSPWLAERAVDTRSVGLAAVAIVAAAGIARLVSAHRLLEAAELGLLVATFAVAPPLAAFGLYFGGWHALRHTGRLLDLARNRRREGGHRDSGWKASGALLLRSSALPTAAALATVVALWELRDLASLQAEVGVLLALTFPHAAVVWALDRHEAARR